MGSSPSHHAHNGGSPDNSSGIGRRPVSPLSASGRARKDVVPDEGKALKLSSHEHELLLQTHAALVARGIDEVGVMVERRFFEYGDDQVRRMLETMRPDKKRAMFDFIISSAIVTCDYKILTAHASVHCGKGLRPRDFDLLHRAVIDVCHEILGPDVWTPTVAAAYESAFTRASNLLMGAVDDLDPSFCPSPRTHKTGSTDASASAPALETTPPRPDGSSGHPPTSDTVAPHAHLAASDGSGTNSPLIGKRKQSRVNFSSHVVEAPAAEVDSSDAP